ncbi:MAG TPA: hypothetical protein VK153_02985 [Candidatus Paceibacterota bacterium]|nr:hypothetical protein [Candidatus Paceibacterota bacterium]
MENSFQTSFIPKKPVTSAGPDKEPKSLFSIISIFLFIFSILLSGGLFLYKIYLTGQQETLSSTLLKTRESFEKDTIDELELFNKRTEATKTILSKHIVLSPLFSLLGEITIPSVQYTKFEHQTNEKGFYVEIEGIARDYRSIALQADMFNTQKGRYFKNVLFSNLMKDKSNNITFNLKFNVDPAILSYENSIKAEDAKPVEVPSTTTIPTSTTTSTSTTTDTLSNGLDKTTQ